MRLFLEVADQVGYESGKVRLVLNRADSALGIRMRTSSTPSAEGGRSSSVTGGASSTLKRGDRFILSNREAQV